MAAIRQVPPLQRRALVLAAFGGWTAKQVSEREGVPLGTAKTRIRSGLLALRDLLRVASEQEPVG
jgi:RNA polymerase sigma-70 factor (ECF subfamily)